MMPMTSYQNLHVKAEKKRNVSNKIVPFLATKMTPCAFITSLQGGRHILGIKAVDDFRPCRDIRPKFGNNICYFKA
jgi:hypothetical protein